MQREKVLNKQIIISAELKELIPDKKKIDFQ
jgi:hypothetical protein